LALLFAHHMRHHVAEIQQNPTAVAALDTSRPHFGGSHFFLDAIRDAPNVQIRSSAANHEIVKHNGLGANVDYFDVFGLHCVGKFCY
jgi:hypothetical protein